MGVNKNYRFLNDLNDEQLNAATETEGPLLILAGAGSGKTKTIVARTALIIANDFAKANEILIMTFTNKAAREMKERGQKILIDNNLWKGESPEFTTFHSWGVKFLKSMTTDILSSVGIKKNFNIADDSDQVVILNKLIPFIFNKKEQEEIKASNLLLPVGNLQNKLISFLDKDLAITQLDKVIEEDGVKWLEGSFPTPITDSVKEKIIQLYMSYKFELRKNNLIDFEDLINLPIRILSENETLKTIFREKYKYIMVDEFQDTNGSQLTLLNLLLSEDLNICVVGDDSQSIYGWRGANINYILNFHNTYKNTKKINLKINYRSSKLIVKRANTLLKSSKQKHEFKEFLEAFKESEGIIKGKFFKYSDDEARYISNLIRKIIDSKKTVPGEIAVLYRSAIVNRKIETELIANRINYKIHRGKTLLERKAAVEIINYLKLLTNLDNSLALAKVLSCAKILSDKRIAEFHDQAESLGMSLMNYIEEGEFNIKGLTKSVIEKVNTFALELKYYKNLLSSEVVSFSEFLNNFFERNCVSNAYKNVVKKKLAGEKVAESSYDSAMSAIKIIEIVRDLAKKYNNIEEFLEIVSLEGEEEDKEDNKVNLMTVHASKGLEFEHVFVAGFSQGVFPSSRNLGEKDIEEERRLAYVALTRAKHGLFVTGSETYFGGQNEERKAPSQFYFESKIEF